MSSFTETLPVKEPLVPVVVVVVVLVFVVVVVVLVFVVVVFVVVQVVVLVFVVVEVVVFVVVVVAAQKSQLSQNHMPQPLPDNVEHTKAKHSTVVVVVVVFVVDVVVVVVEVVVVVFVVVEVVVLPLMNREKLSSLMDKAPLCIMLLTFGKMTQFSLRHSNIWGQDANLRPPPAPVQAGQPTQNQ